MVGMSKILLTTAAVGLLATTVALAQSAVPSVKGAKIPDPATGTEWFYAKVEVDGGKAILARCLLKADGKGHCEGRAL